MDYLLDTNVVIYLQQGRLAAPLPHGRYGISVITEMELLSFAGLTDTQMQWLHRFLDAVVCVELGPDIRASAVLLRRQYRLKLPDAIIAATALVKNATLMTLDQELARLPELRIHPVGLLPS